MSLVAFLWRYLRRYAPWGVFAVAAVGIYALATAGMISLIEPIFNDVLRAGPQEMALGVPGLPAADPGGGAGAGAGETAAVEVPGWLDSINLKQSLADVYDGLKGRLGISDREVIFFTPLLFVLVFLLRAASAFVSGYSFQRIGLGATTDMRNDLYEHIIHQSSRFHGQYTSGELISRVVSDIGKLQAAVTSRLFDVLQQTVTLIALLILLLGTHLQLALISLVATPAFLYAIVRFGKGMRFTSHRSQERMADLSSLLAEGIRGNRVVKAFGMEDFECERFNRATARHLRVNLRAQVIANISSPVIESLAAVGAGALLIYAAHLIRDGRLDAPLLIQFLVNLLMLYDPIRRLNKVNLILQEAAAVVHRIRHLLLTSNEIVDRPTEPPLATVAEGIRFESVHFAYERQSVLTDLTLEIRRGEMVALVGRSGAGKSTVVNLLPRFFDPDRGLVLIDGIDIRQLPLANLRSLIGMVTQETVLFDDTVRNNIAYGQAEMPEERVREAAAAAYADEFIMQLDHGYDTVIGESGQQLSGGQRQRLAIARALLKNAPILILDEATSHLDTESEALVQRALSNLMEGRTALVIAHRLSTVMRADRIVVMSTGRILEEGSHEQLLDLGGAYKRLYDLQFRS